MRRTVTTTVLVTGGTGNLGRHVVRRLIIAGHQVRVASRSTQPPEQALDHQWATVDYRTRAGLANALAGVDTVVHCASGSAKGEAESIAALLSSGKRAGLQHLIYISIVGVDKLPVGYYRAKLSSERALIASGIPWTILRATQFHDLALTVVRGMCKLPIGIVPKGVSCQPIAVDEVADRLVELAGEPPAGRAPELGGPEIRLFADLARMYLRSVGKRKRVIAVPLPGKMINSLRKGGLLTPDHADGVQTFADFLAADART
jgi:uncharacterized protein YbjT (DUF2867 family)